MGFDSLTYAKCATTISGSLGKTVEAIGFIEPLGMGNLMSISSRKKEWLSPTK
jgi:hypothetical protein